MAKWQLIKERGVFLNPRRRFIYLLIRERKCMSYEDLLEAVTKAENAELRMKKTGLDSHLYILKETDYIYQEDSFGQKIYRATWFSSKNL